MIKIDLINEIKNSQKGINIENFINFSLFSKKGYYKNLKAIGGLGDFTTAPEISQLFGEIIGLYLLNVWNSKINTKINLIELGPGNGTLISDILNITKSYKKFHKNISIKLVEKNKFLRKNQKEKLNNIKNINFKWYDNFKKIEPKTSIIIANEFFDCFPIRQFHKRSGKWYEKYINFDHKDKRFFFQNYEIQDQKTLSLLKPIRENFLEFSQTRENYFDEICKYIYKNRGVIILIDYGYYENNNGFTLQSVFNHRNSNIFDNIGKQDITALVDFKRFIKIAKKNNLNIINYSTQSKFLISNGIKQRKEIIEKNCSVHDKEIIQSGYQRLIDNDKMGSKFKVMVISKL